MTRIEKEKEILTAQIANDAFIQAGWKIAVRRRKTDNSPALVALSQTAPRQITLTLAIE